MSRMRYIEQIYRDNLRISFRKKKKFMRYKEVGYDNRYLLFKDGSVYSFYNNGLWLKPYAQKNKDKTHWAYHLRLQHKKTMVYIARLLYFHFKKHSFRSIDEMGLVSYKNNDSNDLRLKNLYITTQKEINKKAMRLHRRKSDATSKIKDTKNNINLIQKLLDANYSYKKIGLLYNCSEMSVYRFIKRNNLTVNKKH